MEPLYDIFFTGQLVEGTTSEQAQLNLAKLFKTTPEKVAHLFNGKPAALKRGVDKAGALQYKAALHKAGMMIAFKAHQASAEKSAPAASQANQEEAHATAADTPAQAKTDAVSDFDLAPTGSDILTANERQEFVEADIDTSEIKMVSAFMEIEPEQETPPPAPDTSHISVAATGEDLLVDKPEPPPPLPLNIDDIDLAPPGTELEELRPDLPPLDPDTSALSMAPAGADILEGVEKEAPPPPPNTDHLSAE